MATIRLGLRDVGQFQAAERPESWRETIAFDFPSGPNGLIAMLGLMERQDITDSKGHYWAKSMTDSRIYVNNGAGYDGAATSILVDDGAGVGTAKSVVKNWQLFNPRTNEMMSVTADPTNTTTLVVARGQAGSTAAAIVDNDPLIIVGPAFADGSSAPTAQYVDPTKFDFFTQIFKASYSLSRRAVKVKSRTGDQLREHKREALERIAKGMEMAALFGIPYATSDPETGTEKTFAGGLLYHVRVNAPSNYTAAQGSMTLNQLNAHLKSAFEYGDNEKLALCGNTTIQVIQDIALNNATLNIEPAQELYGIRVNRLTCAFGDLYLHSHPLLNQVSENGSMWITDTTQIKEHAIDELDLITGAEPNDADYIKDYFQADLGWEWGTPRAHYIVRGITVAA